MFNRKDLQLLGCCLISIAMTLAFVVWKIDNITGDAAGALKFLRSMNIIKSSYHGEINQQKLFDGAIDGMVKALDDPYSAYLDEKNFAKLNELTEGSFGGIGIVFGKKDDEYVVISALPDNPGALAGIKNGDIIVSVDGTLVRELNMDEVAQKIRGKVGTEVTLVVKDKNGNEKTVTVVRQDIKTPSVGGQMLEGTKIGYIRIAVFNESTGEDFKKIYTELESKGMEATLLDLRANPGGLLDGGVAVAKMLVPKGPIVSIAYKDGTRYTESSELEKVKYPLAVLVDNGTASAAEIVAGAVKDTKAGRLFGVKTFGKGSVQGVYKVDDTTGLKITIAKYYTPSGTSIHNVGIEPDEEIKLPDNAEIDLQLKASKEYLLKKLEEEGK